MYLPDFLSPERVVFLHSRTKEWALEEMENAVCDDKAYMHPHEVLEAIWKREKIILVTSGKAAEKLPAGLGARHTASAAITVNHGSRFDRSIALYGRGVAYSEMASEFLYWKN